MRYFNCQKREIFELFAHGLLPSQIYDKAKVKKHTLFNYYQEWKGEQKRLREAAERIRLAKERDEKLRNEKLQKEAQLQNQYTRARSMVLELGARYGRAADEVERSEIDKTFQEAFSKLIEISIQLYPDCTDISSIARKMLGKK